MDFSKQQADPRRHLVGFMFVILFHAFVVYALVTGLAKKVVDVVRAPIDTKVIEEIKKPPPPEDVAPPPPKLEAPPPPYIPPPEVQITTPPTEPTITAVPSPTPPAPVAIAPVGPPAAGSAPAAVPATTGAHCETMPRPEMPNISATGRISMIGRIVVKRGKVVSVEISNFRGTTDRKAQRLLASSVESAMREYVCPGDWPALTQEFVFDIKD